MPVQARKTSTTGAMRVGNVLEIQQSLKDRTAELRLARDELQQTTTELMLTTLELDERVEQRTRELQQAREELQRTNSELLLLTMELEERVERRTQELAYPRNPPIIAIRSREPLAARRNHRGIGQDGRSGGSSNAASRQRVLPSHA